MACLALGLFCGLYPGFKGLDLEGLDTGFRLRRILAPPSPEEAIVIVGIDEASTRAIPEPLALYHRPLGRFLEAMAEAGPRAVGLDLVLPEHSWDDLAPGSDVALMRGILRLKRSTPLVLGRTVGLRGIPRPIHPPLETVAGQAGLGFVQVQPEADQMVRRFETRLGEGGHVFPTLAGRLAEVSGHRPEAGYIHFALGMPFEYIPFHRVLDWHAQGRIQELRAAFQDRTVLLGSVLPYDDRILLPVRLAAWEPASTRDSPGVLLQAQILRTLLGDATVRPCPPWVLLGLALLAALGGMLLGRTPRRGSLLLLGLHPLLALAACLALGQRVFLPVTGLAAALDLGFLVRFSAGLVREHLQKVALEKELAWARVLEESHRELVEVQERLAQVLASPPDLLENLPAWTQAMGLDIQRSLGLADLGIFELRLGELRVMKGAEGLPTPTLAQLRASLASGELPGVGFLVPARGMSGDLQAVLLASTPRRDWAPSMQLLEGFAAQLGNALEMLQVRRRLAQVEATQASTLEDLQARGIETLKVCPRCGLCAGHLAERCADDGTELEVPGILPLHFLERYRLTRRLGVGGMGAVYEARDQHLDRDVAIKVVRPELFHDATTRLRFEREIRTLVQVSHPNVVTVFDSGQVGDGSQFLIMERLRGMDLATVLRRYGPGEPVQVARLVVQAAEALAAAHAKGIIHRDIKPQNLFLVPKGTSFLVKILDFGIATTVAGDGRLTQSGLMMGTPAYMAPERILGREADERSDLHALATVVYEALLGQAVHADEALSQIIQRVLYDAPLRPTQLIPGLPEAVDLAFEAALAKEPSDRPRDILAWARRLGASLEGLEGRGRGWPEPMVALEGPEGFQPPLDGTTLSILRTHAGPP